jgi:hypothetical protein
MNTRGGGRRKIGKRLKNVKAEGGDKNNIPFVSSPFVHCSQKHHSTVY